MSERQSIAASLGELLASFTGEHVGRMKPEYLPTFIKDVKALIADEFLKLSRIIIRSAKGSRVED